MRPCKLHLGREVSIYAFCDTLAAKVNLINCENVFPSGISWFLPDGKRFNIVSSGEKALWPEEKHLNDVSSGEKRVLPDGRA